MKKLFAVLLSVLSFALVACHGDSDGNGNGDPFITDITTVEARGCETGGIIYQGMDPQGRRWGWSSPVGQTIRDDPNYHGHWADTNAIFVPDDQEAGRNGLIEGLNYVISDGKRAEDSCLRL